MTTRTDTDALPTAKRWPRFVSASVACHVGAGALAAAVPAAWPWALGAVVANHLVLTGGGLWPRSGWMGRNWTHLPDAARARGEIALTIDDGPDPEVTPQVLDLLDALEAKATFFAIAEHATRHAAVVGEIVRRGHSVQNHSDRHSKAFSLLGPTGMAREIAAAQQRLADASGVLPRWFRAPAGLRNPFLPLVLDSLGLELVSWTRRGFDTVRHDPAQVADALVDRLAAGDILLAHDGNAARMADGRAVVLGVLPRVVERARAAGLRFATLPEAFGPATAAVAAPA